MEAVQEVPIEKSEGEPPQEEPPKPIETPQEEPPKPIETPQEESPKPAKKPRGRPKGATDKTKRKPRAKRAEIVETVIEESSSEEEPAPRPLSFRERRSALYASWFS